MMQAMPPQGGAPDPQDPSAGGDSGGGSGAQQLISAIEAGMQKLGMLLEKSGAAGQEELQEYSQLVQGFQSFIENLTSGGEDKSAPQSVSSPEAGANPNAKPMMG